MTETNDDGGYPHVVVDDEVGAIYIKLGHNSVARTKSYDNHGIMIDFDCEGSPMGIEILL